MDSQDERQWWAPSPEFLQHHPSSVDSTIGLFPVSWRELIQGAYGGPEPWVEKIRAKFADPDYWLVIPEFDVLPENVDYIGFDLPLEWDFALATWELQSVVRTSRTLARQQFKSLADLHNRRLRGRPEQREKQAATAEVYECVIENLISYIDRRLTSEDRVLALGNAASFLAQWVSSGPGAALQRMREGASIGGRKGSERRRTENKVQDKDRVISTARSLGWPNSTYGVIKALDGQFPIGYSRIQQILSEEKKRILQVRGLPP